MLVVTNTTQNLVAAVNPPYGSLQREAQNTTHMPTVVIWMTPKRLRSPKQNHEDLLPAKDVTNEKGSPLGELFLRVDVGIDPYEHLHYVA